MNDLNILIISGVYTLLFWYTLRNLRKMIDDLNEKLYKSDKYIRRLKVVAHLKGCDLSDAGR